MARRADLAGSGRGGGRSAPSSRRARRVRFRQKPRDRKSTRLNSSRLVTSYAVFCLKKKNRLYRTIHAAAVLFRPFVLRGVVSALVACTTLPLPSFSSLLLTISLHCRFVPGICPVRS